MNRTADRNRTADNRQTRRRGGPSRVPLARIVFLSLKNFRMEFLSLLKREPSHPFNPSPISFHNVSPGDMGVGGSGGGGGRRILFHLNLQFCPHLRICHVENFQKKRFSVFHYYLTFSHHHHHSYNQNISVNITDVISTTVSIAK